MDTELEASLKTYEVSFALLPLVSKSQPKAQGAASDSPAAPKNQTTYGSAKGGKKATFRPKPYSAKGKGKGKKSEQRIPKEIREAGGTASTADGAPICFDFAFKRCREAVAEGSRCKKGYHFCCICYGPLCLNVVMQFSFTAAQFCNLTMKMPKRVVPISLFLLITWSLSPSVNLQMSRNASMPKTHLSLNFVLVLHESQHASSS